MSAIKKQACCLAQQLHMILLNENRNWDSHHFNSTTATRMANMLVEVAKSCMQAVPVHVRDLVATTITFNV